MSRTKQQKRLAIAIEDLVGDLYAKEGGFVCRGVLMHVYPEVTALVDKMLTCNCHGGSIREKD